MLEQKRFCNKISIIIDLPCISCSRLSVWAFTLTVKLIQSSSPSLSCVLWDFSDTCLPQIRAHLVTDYSVIISLCSKVLWIPEYYAHTWNVQELHRGCINHDIVLKNATQLKRERKRTGDTTREKGRDRGRETHRHKGRDICGSLGSYWFR